MNSYTDKVKFLLEVCKRSAKPVNCAIWVTRKHKFRALCILRSLLSENTANLSHYTQNSIYLKNKSKVDILCCPEDSRGRRYTLTFYEKDIDEKFLSYVIYPTTTNGLAPDKFCFEEGEL